MDEARRFLRYVVPGMTASLELLLLQAVSGLGWSFPWKTSEEISTGEVLLLFLTVGVVGYIFATTHHCLIWLVRGYGPNHLDFAKREGWLPEQALDDRRNRREAWQRFTAAWHERLGHSARLQGASPRVDSFTDLMHGAGASFVGSCIAGSVAAFATRDTPHSILVVLLAVVFVALFLFSYLLILDNCKEVVEIILKNQLVSENQEPCWIRRLRRSAPGTSTLGHQMGIPARFAIGRAKTTTQGNNAPYSY
jgi:hypothetical protein